MGSTATSSKIEAGFSFGTGLVGPTSDMVLVESTVYVLVTDGLEWVLGWRQFGVKCLKVVLMTPLAREQWENFLATFGDLLPKEWQVVENIEKDHTGVTICAIMLTDIDVKLVSPFCESHSSSTCLVIATARSMRGLNGRTGRLWGYADQRHSSLGGLTRARLTLAWSNGGGCAPGVLPARNNVAHRDPSLFLEPSAPLLIWEPIHKRHTFNVWKPGSGDQPRAPWPVTADLWLETRTVYLGKDILRPVSDKEWAQLHDIRPEWGERLRTPSRAWRNGKVIPLRYPVELALRSRQLGFSSAVMHSKDLNLGLMGRRLNGTSEIYEQGLYRGWVRELSDVLDVGAATTSDEAGVPLHLWAVGGLEEGLEDARGLVRNFLFRWWLRKTTREATGWLRQRNRTYPQDSLRDKAAVADCIRRLSGSTWFEWNAGSRLLYWRWPPIWLAEARDGMPAMVVRRPPKRVRWPTVPQEDWVKALEVKKLAKLIKRGYLETGFVATVIPRFCVPKGTEDVRMVWDLTQNEVNPGVHASPFTCGVFCVCG